MKNNISAINTGATALGSIVGPISASLLTEYIGYQWGCMIFAIFVGTFGIILFYAVFIYKDKEGDLIAYREINADIQLAEDSRSMNISHNES